MTVPNVSGLMRITHRAILSVVSVTVSPILSWVDFEDSGVIDSLASTQTKGYSELLPKAD